MFVKHRDSTEKRREDAHALLKLRKTEKPLSVILHEVLWECDKSSHRFCFLNITIMRISIESLHLRLFASICVIRGEKLRKTR
jgi:hypothetical protein